MRRMRLLVALFGLIVLSGCRLYGWGGNALGQLGDGTSASKLSPALSVADGDWSSLAAGAGFACGVRLDRTVWCWGGNDHGQLGDGTTTERHSPTQAGSATDWKRVSSGTNHACAVRTNASLWCWGDNDHGQLGDGTTTDATRAGTGRVGAATGRTSRAGETTPARCARTATLWCWGDNDHGQLGDGTTTHRHAPDAGRHRHRLGERDSAGVDHTCAVRTDGDAVVLGRQRPRPARRRHHDRTTHADAGRVGRRTGRASARARPHLRDRARRRALVLGRQRPRPARRRHHDRTARRRRRSGRRRTGRASARARATPARCAPSGTLWCWGDNDDGQLGDGTTIERHIPTQAGSAADWTLVTSGDVFSLGSRNDCAQDADADRLPDCAETDTGVFVSSADTGSDPNLADTDGDAIKDGDEVLGTVDGLDAARPGHEPAQEEHPAGVRLVRRRQRLRVATAISPRRPSISRYESAFASAPVSNPDGTTGIDVISDYGQGGLFTRRQPDRRCRRRHRGAGLGGAEFLNYKAANFAANRNGYFHYVLMPHRYGTTSNSSG